MTQAAEPLGGGEPRRLPTRRDRLRAATKEEILQTARRLLVQDGPDGVSLRAIAREMGMTAPGLYRYFASHEELLRNVVASMFTELAAGIHQAITDASDAYLAAHAGECPAQPAGSPSGRAEAGHAGQAEAGHAGRAEAGHLTAKLVASCRAFRAWSLAHQQEFGLLFGVPLPGFDDGRYDIADECALQLADTFLALYLDLWRLLPFPVLAADEIEPGLVAQLNRYRDALGTDLPAGAMLTFLRCWMLLYGAVAMEVFGHLNFALSDPAPMFDLMLSDVARLVGLRYPAD